MQSSKEIDPVTFSVFFLKLAAIGHEMSVTMEHTSRNSILNESKDFSCSIFDHAGRLISQEEEVLPIHTVAGSVVLKEMIKDLMDDLAPGDIIICNYPYRGNAHIADLSMACPVFYQGKLMFWAVTRAHQLDIGSPIPSSVRADAPDLYSEGLKIPPLRIYREYREIKDVVNLYRVNVRYQDMWYGDLQAQVASVLVAERRLMELCDAYGPEKVVAYADALIDYSDRRMAEEIRSIPDGVYSSVAFSDNDGVGNDSVRVECKLIIKDDMITVDLSGSQEQTKGSTNSSLGNTIAQVGTAIFACIDPTIPHTEGCLNHIRVIAPEGTVVNAKWPAGTSNCTIVIGDTICEAVWKAMSMADPKRAPAGWGKQSGTNLVTSGFDKAKNEWYGYQTFKASSGGGASWGHDGWNTILTATTLGGTRCQGVEAEEFLYPHFIIKHELWPDSAGPGRWRGGFGSQLIFKPVGHEMTCIFFGDGHLYPPHGAVGGKSGRGSIHYTIHNKLGVKTTYGSNGKFIMTEDETYYGYAAGGGGIGDPFERDPEKVEEDVRDGLISLAAAEEEYGVFIDPATLKVDEERTRELRKTKRRG